MSNFQDIRNIFQAEQAENGSWYKIRELQIEFMQYLKVNNCIPVEIVDYPMYRDICVYLRAPTRENFSRIEISIVLVLVFQGMDCRDVTKVGLCKVLTQLLSENLTDVYSERCDQILHGIC